MADEENGACMVNGDKSIEYTFGKLNQGLHASSSVHGTNTRARTFLYSCTYILNSHVPSSTHVHKY